VWVVTDEAPEVHGNDLICSLRLPVRFWVECRREIELHADQVKELLLKIAGEDRVTITHDGAQDPVEPHDLVEERLGDCCGSVRVRQGDEVYRFGELVHHGEDDRLPIDTREPLDEVHGDVGPDYR
jgi:hypothetical protein